MAICLINLSEEPGYLNLSRRTVLRIRRISSACLLCAAFLTGATLADDIPVRWYRSIYAPSYGLDDDRLVTHQSQFVGLYEKWSPPVQFSLYISLPEGKPKKQAVTFNGCGQFLKFNASRSDIGWENARERLRYFMQVSSCKAWEIMPGLSSSKTSHLPDFAGTGKTGLEDSEKVSREIIVSALRLGKKFKVDILAALDLSDDWSIDCRLESECRYVVFDNGFETLLIDFVARGDYDKDGIEDLLVTLASPVDPFKKTFYIGLIFTRKTDGGELEVVGRF
jgi:hypothetical protein